MASFSRQQWAAISVGLILFAALFFINRKPPLTGVAQPTGEVGHALPSMSIDSVFMQADAQVPVSLRTEINKIKEAIPTANPQVKATLLDSIVNICDSAGAQITAGFYAEKLAQVKNSTELWYQAGDRYYKCAEIVNNKARVPLLQRAMQCFDNSLKIDSDNLVSMVGKGECIVEGGGNPMQGIMMIEGVLKKDSNNEKAEIALGTFSIQSGQYSKAIVRFSKVLKIDPTFSEAYIYLAEASEKSGDKTAAVGYLKKYNTFVRDSAIKNQVNNYINKLENDTTGQ